MNRPFLRRALVVAATVVLIIFAAAPTPELATPPPSAGSNTSTTAAGLASDGSLDTDAGSPVDLRVSDPFHTNATGAATGLRGWGALSLAERPFVYPTRLREVNDTLGAGLDHWAASELMWRNIRFHHRRPHDNRFKRNKYAVFLKRMEPLMTRCDSFVAVPGRRAAITTFANKGGTMIGAVIDKEWRMFIDVSNVVYSTMRALNVRNPTRSSFRTVVAAIAACVRSRLRGHPPWGL